MPRAIPLIDRFSPDIDIFNAITSNPCRNYERKFVANMPQPIFRGSRRKAPTSSRTPRSQPARRSFSEHAARPQSRRDGGPKPNGCSFCGAIMPLPEPCARRNSLDRHGYIRESRCAPNFLLLKSSLRYHFFLAIVKEKFIADSRRIVYDNAS